MGHYKWLVRDAEGRPIPIYGTGQYPPPGEWTPDAVGTLEPCSNGWHVCSAAQVPYWCGAELWEVEVAGDVVRTDDKIVARRMRFVRQLRWTTADMVAYAEASAAHAEEHARAARAASYARAARYSARYSACAASYARAARYSARDAARAASYARDASDEELAWQRKWIEARIGETLA